MQLSFGHHHGRAPELCQWHHEEKTKIKSIICSANNKLSQVARRGTSRTDRDLHWSGAAPLPERFGLCLFLLGTERRKM
jgi:hypothetical protein